CVAMLMAAYQECAGNVERRAFACEGRVDLAARQARAGGKLKCLVARVLAKLDQPGDEMEGLGVFALELDVVHGGLGPDRDLSHGVPLQLASPQPGIALDEFERCARLHKNHIPRRHACGLGAAAEIDEMDRLAEG